MHADWEPSADFRAYCTRMQDEGVDMEDELIQSMGETRTGTEHTEADDAGWQASKTSVVFPVVHHEATMGTNEPNIGGILYPTRQWRVVMEDYVAHLEVDLVERGWSRDFVAEKFPKGFAAEIAWKCYLIGREERREDLGDTLVVNLTEWVLDDARGSVLVFERVKP